LDAGHVLAPQNLVKTHVLGAGRVVAKLSVACTSLKRA
jgi:hypothetical protein